MDDSELALAEGPRSDAGRAAKPFPNRRRPEFLIYELRRLVLVAMAAAAVRFSTPSLA